jgi:hypothetical protein
MSGKEKNLIKQARLMGQPIPDRIKNKPFLKTGLNLYFNAFLDLQSDRNDNGNIPWTVKVTYARFYEFDEIQTENLIYFLSRMDEAYNKWSKKNQGEKNGKNLA